MSEKMDLKIKKQINHFTNESWYELFEIESGESLEEGTKEECEAFFESLDSDKYELLPD